MRDRRNRERRSTTRSRVLRGAKIVLGKSSMEDCVVRNVTNTGARIHISKAVDLPEAFGGALRRVPITLGYAPATVHQLTRNACGTLPFFFVQDV